MDVESTAVVRVVDLAVPLKGRPSQRRGGGNIQHETVGKLMPATDWKPYSRTKAIVPVSLTSEQSVVYPTDKIVSARTIMTVVPARKPTVGPFACAQGQNPAHHQDLNQPSSDGKRSCNKKVAENSTTRLQRMVDIEARGR